MIQFSTFSRPTLQTHQLKPDTSRFKGSSTPLYVYLNTLDPAQRQETGFFYRLFNPNAPQKSPVTLASSRNCDFWA
ncbi:MAG: hypothetical protein K2X01_01760 [Cyanobacteria bacterium]|nr:hypothetical protein [Cyanobacteriota bacterium]